MDTQCRLEGQARELFEHYRRCLREKETPPLWFGEREIPPVDFAELGRPFGWTVKKTKALYEHVKQEMLRLNQLKNVYRPSGLSATRNAPQPDEQVRKYTGMAKWPNAEDNDLYWEYERRNIYPPGTVDLCHHEEQIVLVPETEEYLYGTQSARVPDYVRGSRPMLEEIVVETTTGKTSDQEKVIAILNWCSIPYMTNNKYKHGIDNLPFFIGGTEEEIIKAGKGPGLCNEVARVFCFLCQVAGFPARIVFLYPRPRANGHAASEVFVEGRWAFFDQTCNAYYELDNGQLASALDLKRAPHLIDKSPDLGYLLIYKGMFTGLISIVPYDIDRTAHYNYTWHSI